MIKLSQIPLPDNTQHSQQTNIHASDWIRNHNLSSRAAEDLRLRPRGHWDRQVTLLLTVDHSNYMYKKFGMPVSHTMRCLQRDCSREMNAKCFEESCPGLNEVFHGTWLEKLSKTRENFRQDSQLLQEPFKYYAPRQARSTNRSLLLRFPG